MSVVLAVTNAHDEAGGLLFVIAGSLILAVFAVFDRWGEARNRRNMHSKYRERRRRERREMERQG